MIRERVEHLLRRLPAEPQFATQGRTLFVDLERQQVQTAYTPLEVVRAVLEGRGANMFYLYNLVDTDLDPLSPENPLIFGSGILTGFVPSAARGNASGWSPESRILMDSNAGDYFPSFLKLSQIDRLVLYGRAAEWTLLLIEKGELRFGRADRYVGLDNLELRPKLCADLGGVEGKDISIAAITRAGESGALCAGIMAGPKAIYARGGTGAKMGSLKLKAIATKGRVLLGIEGADAKAVKPYNREIATQLLRTGVVRGALSIRGTPFLYRPSRLLGAMGTLNNQKNTWTEALDAENLDRWRPGMAGCFRCPVNCRPLNDLGADGFGDRYDKGDGPEYVTVGKFGPNIGIEDPRWLIRFNNICNDLGLDTASTGSAIGWAMELYQRGLIDRSATSGMDLTWGNAAAVEKLLHQTSTREGFGAAIADSAAAVRTGRYPEQALDYRNAVKGLFQSDPHDARILKAFALGLAVATRGSDHLRNRVTLEINSKINDSPEFKAQLYGPGVSPEPTSYAGKEIAVRVCENVFGVGDAVGMCRFTTHLFNSPSLPGLEQFQQQIHNVTGLVMEKDQLERAGDNINGIERLLNYGFGTRRVDDTLPRRWFEEGMPWGPYAGEKIDRAQFDALLDRFYTLRRLNREGIPELGWRAELLETMTGFSLTLRLPVNLRALGDGAAVDGAMIVDHQVGTIGELIEWLRRRYPKLTEELSSSVYNFAVNEEIVLHQRDRQVLRSGDVVEVVPTFAGG